MCTLDKILELIEKNNIKQKDLTDYLGISKNAFTNWKGGFSQSYNRYLPQIAEFFNVSIDYLAGRESKQTEEQILTYGNSKKDELKKKIDSIDLPDDKIDLLLNMIDSWI